MREILFRGKDRFDGEWYVGSLTHDRKYGNCFIEICVHQGITKEVIPETVGQYTGVKDLHGKSVFEGDIVKIHLSGKPAIGVVEFGITGIAAYIVKNIDKVSSNYVLEFDKPNLYEVVGNGFDNSLEGKT